MPRQWTDPRDGKSWQVSLRGPGVKGLPLVREPDGPRQPNHIVFRGDVAGGEMSIGVFDRGSIDPDKMGDWELQGYLDAAWRALPD